MEEEFNLRGVTAEVFDQHAKSWCGACYVVAVVQVVEDRGNLLLGKRTPRQRIDMQVVFDHFHDSGMEDGWNACHGGFPRKVVACLAEKRCPLKVTQAPRWFGHPRSLQRTLTSDAPFVVTGGERLPAARVKDELRAHGPVVLEVNAGVLKLLDARGVVTARAYAQPNHAVAVVGWVVRGGVGCWVVRNSWGKKRVPADIPDDLSCVTHAGNGCTVQWEYWVGDPEDPGYCYLPVEHPCATVDDPWIAPRVELAPQP